MELVRRLRTNSLLNLSALEKSLATSRVVTFEARNAGTISVPLFRGGRTATVLISTGGVLPVARLEELGGFTISGMTVEFLALTNLVGGNVTVNNGAVVTAPSLVSHVPEPGCFVHVWGVTGAGSLLDLSPLTNLAGPTCGGINIEATSGGTVILSNLTAVTEGALSFLADGTNSRVDLGGLQQSFATLRNVTFEARNNGTMWVPLFLGGPTVLVTLASDGMLPVSQLEELSGFDVSGMTLEFSSLTDLGRGNVTVQDGTVVTAPVLASHLPDPGCATHRWLATGAGSVLDLSPLTNVAGPSCGWLNIEATVGGTVIMNNLATITEGTLTFRNKIALALLRCAQSAKAILFRSAPGWPTATTGVGRKD